jgi:hypothetical protein
MDDGEAIQLLERPNQKFEFPVKWSIDLQAERTSAYLAEKHAKKPVIAMNYPKAIKAFYMRLTDDGQPLSTITGHGRNAGRPGSSDELSAAFLRSTRPGGPRRHHSRRRARARPQ